jgi:hypothetical protein
VAYLGYRWLTEKKSGRCAKNSVLARSPRSAVFGVAAGLEKFGVGVFPMVGSRVPQFLTRQLYQQ